MNETFDNSNNQTVAEILAQPISQESVGEIIAAIEAEPFACHDCKKLRIILCGLLRSLYGNGANSESVLDLVADILDRKSPIAMDRTKTV